MISFKILPTPLECYTLDNVKIQFTLLVKRGCASFQHVEIDFQKSKEVENHYCEQVDCFLYEKEFNPVFILVDEVSKTRDLFNGFYNLTVIGGGVSRDQMVYYTDRKIHDYNYRQGSTLVMGRKPTNGYQWLCGSESACGGITPDFPHTAEFYFIVLFTNRGLDNNSNCDYTFEFNIKLHGMPPGSLHPSLLIVLLSMSLILSFLVAMFVVEQRYPQFNARVHNGVNKMQTRLLNGMARLVMRRKQDETVVRKEKMMTPSIIVQDNYSEGSSKDV